MRLVYICHPLTTFGNVEENKKNVQGICERLVEDFIDVVPISPIHAFSGFFSTEGNQDKVMRCCLELLSKCDEIWLCGAWDQSIGCEQELKKAMSLGLRVKVWEKHVIANGERQVR